MPEKHELLASRVDGDGMLHVRVDLNLGDDVYDASGRESGRSPKQVVVRIIEFKPLHFFLQTHPLPTVPSPSSTVRILTELVFGLRSSKGPGLPRHQSRIA